MLLGTLKRTIASAVMATATHARRARRSKCTCRVDGGQARVLIPPVPRSILLAPFLSQLHSTARPSPERYDKRYEEGFLKNIRPHHGPQGHGCGTEDVEGGHKSSHQFQCWW